MSVKWANHHNRPLSESVTYSINAAPQNVGINSFLAPNVRSVVAPNVKKNVTVNNKSNKNNKSNNGASECAEFPERSPAHQKCMDLIALARAKRQLKSGASGTTSSRWQIMPSAPKSATRQKKGRKSGKNTRRNK
jgi:hypothetical protein